LKKLELSCKSLHTGAGVGFALTQTFVSGIVVFGATIFFQMAGG
jgi:hypothetical protein